jgi:hypothetical protein
MLSTRTTIGESNLIPIDLIQLAYQQGPHPLARTPEALQVFKENLAYQPAAGFYELVLAAELLKNPPKNLKISPVVVIPQVNRRARIILNLSFPIRRSGANRKMGPVLVESVNQMTWSLVPQTPVKLIRKVLTELFEFMAGAPP